MMDHRVGSMASEVAGASSTPVHQMQNALEDMRKTCFRLNETVCNVADGLGLSHTAQVGPEGPSDRPEGADVLSRMRQLARAIDMLEYSIARLTNPV